MFLNFYKKKHKTCFFHLCFTALAARKHRCSMTRGQQAGMTGYRQYGTEAADTVAMTTGVGQVIAEDKSLKVASLCKLFSSVH